MVYIKCEGSPTFERLIEGTGIVHIGEDCQVKTSHILIQAQNAYNSSLYSNEQPTIDYDATFKASIQQINTSRFSEIGKFEYTNIIALGESEKLAKMSRSIADLQTAAEKTTFNNLQIRRK